MPLPPDYRTLRAGLLLRLGASTLLVVAGAAGLLALLADGGSVGAPPSVAAPVAAPSVPAAKPEVQPVLVAAPSVVVAMPPDAHHAATPDALLAAALGAAFAPERFDGKTLEVIGQRPADDSSVVEVAPAEREGQAAEAVPPKLPKGPHLQVGIFALPGNAEEFRRKLEAAGYPVYIETRVHVGPYANRREAERAREKLKEQGTAALFIPQ